MTPTAAAIAFGVLAGGSAVALLGLSGWLLARAAQHPSVMYLLVAITAVRAFGIGRAVFRYLERLVGHDAALRWQEAIRERTFRRLADALPVGGRATDRLSRALHDVETMTQAIVQLLLPAGSAAVVVLGATAVLAVFSPNAALAVGVCASLGALAMPLLAAALSARGDQKLAGLRSQLTGVTADLVDASADLYVFDAVEVQLSRVRAADEALGRAERRSAAARGVATAGQLLLLGGAAVAALMIGSRAVLAGALDPPLLAALVLTPLALADVVAGLPDAAQAGVRAWSAMRRLAALDRLPRSPEPEMRRTRPGPLMTSGERIRAEALTVAWPPGPDAGGVGPSVLPLIRPVSFTVRAGERVAVVGPSGVGKTTLAATVLGLIDPAGGRLEVAGRVAYLQQEAYIFDSTLADNVRLGDPAADDEQVAQVLARVGLPADLDLLVGPEGYALSGGERRRLALARLLLRSYDVVVLDEPTEHLDGPTADRLLADLDHVLVDSAVLMITHDTFAMAWCDRVLELEPHGEP